MTHTLTCGIRSQQPPRSSTGGPMAVGLGLTDEPAVLANTDPSAEALLNPAENEPVRFSTRAVPRSGAHGVDVGLGAGVAILEGAFLLRLTSEHLVVAIRVERRIDVDQVNASPEGRFFNRSRQSPQ